MPDGHGIGSHALEYQSVNLGLAVEIVIGLVIGIVLGLTGAGGSVFAVPLFLLLTPMNTSDAMGIALGAVAVSASYGTLSFGRKRVLWTPALLLALGGMFTAPFGKWLAISINETLLTSGFCVLAFVIALRMWKQVKNNPQDVAIVRGDINGDVALPSGLMCRLSPSGQFQLKPRCLSGLIAGGLLIGFMSGLFGVGGGFLIIPLLIYLSQLDMRIAVATSLFVIALVSSTGFISHLFFSPGLNWSELLSIMLASVAGMVLSQLVSKKLAGSTLHKVFAVSLLLVSTLTFTLSLTENLL